MGSNLELLKLAEGIYIFMAPLSQYNSYMGQPQEKNFLWTFYLSKS